MRDHAAIEELIATRALDGLDPGDERALTAQRSEHGADCEECLRLEAAYDEVAGRLAFGLEPAEVRDGFEDELVARARSGAEHPRVGVAEPRPIAERRAARARTVVTVPRRLAAAAAAAIVLLAGLVGYLLAPNGDPTAMALERVLTQPDARTITLHGSGAGALRVVFRPGASEAFVVGSGLPAPSSGRTYELWAFRGKTPVSAGCFAPENGTVIRQLHANLAGTNTMAVTVESQACPAAPTTQPIFSAPL